MSENTFGLSHPRTVQDKLCKAKLVRSDLRRELTVVFGGLRAMHLKLNLSAVNSAENWPLFLEFSAQAVASHSTAHITVIYVQQATEVVTAYCRFFRLV